MNKKYLEGGYIPFRLWFEKNPEFLIYKYEKEGNDYRLFYVTQSTGLSIYFSDKEKYDKFPKVFEVVSGAWYGSKGRWRPTERYYGTLICKDVSVFKNIENKGNSYKFKITKPLLSFRKTVLIESKDIGIIELKCKKIITQEYDVFLLNTLENIWINRKFAIDFFEQYIQIDYEYFKNK